MGYKKRQNKGFVMTELVVATAVLLVLLIVFAKTMNSFSRFNDYQMVRQRCIAAGQAQLDSIAATGGAISEKDFKRLWPKLTVSIERLDGKGQWEGMKLLKVTTEGESFQRRVGVKLCRYFEKGQVK